MNVFFLKILLVIVSQAFNVRCLHTLRAGETIITICICYVGLVYDSIFKIFVVAIQSVHLIFI